MSPDGPAARAPARSRLARWLFPDDGPGRARRERVLAGLFVLLAVVLVARAARKGVGVLVHNQEWGARFLAHEDPYFDPEAGRRIHGPYPPSLSLMAAPLACLPTTAARILWSTLQIGALWAFYRLLRARLGRHWPALAPHASVVFALALLLVSRYLLRDTAGGGGNLLYSLLALSGVELLLAGRTLGAFPLALSLVLKPNLWPLVLFLALRARWRAFASTLAVGALLFCLPGLYFGPRAYAELAQHWVSDVVSFQSLDDLNARDQVPDGMPPARYGMNQSLREATFRMLRPPGDTQAADVSLVTVAPEVASAIGRLLGLALLVYASLRVRQARDARGEWIALLGLLPLALLLSPITWKAHHVDLLPSFGLLVALALADPHARRWLGPFLVGYWVVCDLFSEEIVGSALRDYLQAFSIVTWMDIALVFVVLRFVAAEAQAATPGQSQAKVAPVARA